MFACFIMDFGGKRVTLWGATACTGKSRCFDNKHLCCCEASGQTHFSVAFNNLQTCP